MRRKPSSTVIAFLGVLFLVLFQALPPAHARRQRKHKSPPATVHIEVTVIRASNGKPIHNASVIFHPLKQGEDEGNMELKTNEQGKTSLDVIPVGEDVLLQVIADGYRTFGQKYQIDGNSKSILVKMELPKEQYSVYRSGNAGNAQSNAPQAQMGHAAPTDSPLLTPPPKK